MRKTLLLGKWLAVATVLVLLQATIISTSYAAPPADGWGEGGNGGCSTYHEVRRGETLFSLGRQYGVYPYDIAQANGLYNPDHLYAGQILYIPCTGGGGYGERPMQKPGGGQKPGMGPGMGQKPQPQVGYGYDFTGYYYETYSPIYRRYSYTCGYHYNCY